MLTTIRRIITTLLLAFIGVMLYRLTQETADELLIDATQPAILQQLRAVQRLETAEASIIKIIEGRQQVSDLLPGTSLDNTIAEFLFGESVRMEVYGTATAGFDLSAISTGAVSTISTGAVIITLPQPQILHVSLDPETNVFDRQIGVLSQGDKDTETTLRNQALDLVRQGALDQGILDDAIINAQAALQSILGDSVFIQQVIIPDLSQNNI